MKDRLAHLALACALALPVLPATTPAATAQGAASCSAVWVVRPGDTLARIARACGIPASMIERANPRVDWSRLQVGQRLSLGGGGGGGGGPTSSGGSERYVVQRGDTLSSIARGFGISLQALLAANPGLSERDLQVGRELVFGGRGGADRPAPPRPGNGQRRVDVSVDDSNAAPGGIVRFQIAGLAPGARIVVATNPGQGLAGTDRGTRAGNRGIATAELELPRNARPGQRWTWEVLNEDMRPLASGAYRIGDRQGRPGNPSRPEAGRVRVLGVLSNEGATCPTLRGDDGRLYSLAGDLQGYRGGDRVEVIGEIAQASICMQGTTIGVAAIRSAR